MSLGLSRRHFLVVFVGHVFPEGEGRDETLAAHHTQVWHAPVLSVRVGHVNGQPVLLGKLLVYNYVRIVVAILKTDQARIYRFDRFLGI